MLTLFVWIAQIVTSVIYLQTMYFKLTYAPETQVIFNKLGGRPAATVTALMEVLTAVLLLLPAKVWKPANALGAALSLAVIGGAVMTHLLIVGIRVPTAPGSTETDGGTLFALAVLVLLLSTFVLITRREQLPVLGPTLAPMLSGKLRLPG